MGIEDNWSWLPCISDCGSKAVRDSHRLTTATHKQTDMLTPTDRFRLVAEHDLSSDATEMFASDELPPSPYIPPKNPHAKPGLFLDPYWKPKKRKHRKPGRYVPTLKGWMVPIA
jgi:hypothetical protein